MPMGGAADMTIESFAIVLALIALGCVLAGAVADVIRFEIPDTLSVVLLATALGYGALTPGFDWLAHLVAPVVMFAAGLLIFRFGIMGGGDVKLLISSAAWTGLGGLPLQLVGIALAGGVLAVVLIIARRAAPRFANTGALPRVFHHDAPLPYAVAIAAGTCWWALAAWPVR